MSEPTDGGASTAGSFPLSEFLGMTIEHLEPGRATATIDLADSHQNPHGFVHGAVLFTMADTSMGAATMSVLGDDQRCSTIELHLRFFRPVVEGRLVADTEVLRQGRRIVHLETRIRDGEDRLVAVADGSFAVVDEPPDRARRDPRG